MHFHTPRPRHTNACFCRTSPQLLSGHLVFRSWAAPIRWPTHWNSWFLARRQSRQGAEPGNTEGNQEVNEENWGTCGALPFPRISAFTCALELGTCVQRGFRACALFPLELWSSLWTQRDSITTHQALTWYCNQPVIIAKHKIQEL